MKTQQIKNLDPNIPVLDEICRRLKNKIHIKLELSTRNWLTKQSRVKQSPAPLLLETELCSSIYFGSIQMAARRKDGMCVGHPVE
jgi:hypothetical protein